MLQNICKHKLNVRYHSIAVSLNTIIGYKVIYNIRAYQFIGHKYAILADIICIQKKLIASNYTSYIDITFI